MFRIEISRWNKTFTDINTSVCFRMSESEVDHLITRASESTRYYDATVFKGSEDQWKRMNWNSVGERSM
jgi:hypothetical protein